MAQPDPKGLADRNQWASPFTPELRGGLREKINQYTDPSGTTLTPKQPPRSESRRSKVVQVDAADGPEPPAECIPIDVSAIVVDPVKDPYDAGDMITCEPFGLSGTEPYSYQWFINGSYVTNTQIMTHTLTDGEIMGKDVTGLGSVTITLVVANACGIDTEVGTIPVQGTPP